MKKGDREGKTY